RAFTTAVRGREVVGERADFEGVLPRQDANVVLSDIQGRGRIELLEQPSSSNNFAAKVRILDTAAGAGSYSFSLTWDGDGFQPGATSGGGAYDRNGGYDRGGILTPSGSGAGYGSNGSGGGNSFRWSGRVDGRVRVFAQGGRVWSQTVSGTPVSQERASVGSAMPRASLDADIRKLAGRDDVRLLERPTAGNNYTLVFEIDDEDGGADLYEVEVTWR
ncbi:MAG TPA: hypothetical protein VEQ63_03345, partial [Bryobacteraceae bacterium]|nr:hypothetical protein [Bryobacteraceae bacterium]